MDSEQIYKKGPEIKHISEIREEVEGAIPINMDDDICRMTSNSNFINSDGGELCLRAAGTWNGISMAVFGKQ